MTEPLNFEWRKALQKIQDVAFELNDSQKDGKGILLEETIKLWRYWKQRDRIIAEEMQKIVKNRIEATAGSYDAQKHAGSYP